MYHETSPPFLEVQNVLQVVVDRTKEGFKLYSVGIFLYESESKSLILESSTSDTMNKENKQFSLDDNAVVAEAGRKQSIVLVNDVSQSDIHSFNTHLPNTKSEIALPMVIGNKLIGVLDLQSEVTNKFSEDDIRVLTTLAEQNWYCGTKCKVI